MTDLYGHIIYELQYKKIHSNFFPIISRSKMPRVIQKNTKAAAESKDVAAAMEEFHIKKVTWQKIGSGKNSNVFQYGDAHENKVVKTCKCPCGSACLCKEGCNLRKEFEYHKAVLTVLGNNTVKLFAISPESSERTFIVMSRMPLRSAESIKALTNAGLYKLDLKKVLDIIIDICDKLNEMNASGIYHGDTPSNIFLIKDKTRAGVVWRWMIIDFGYAVNQGKADDREEHPFYDHGLRTPDSTMWLYALNYFAMKHASIGSPISRSIVNVLKPIIVSVTGILKVLPVRQWVLGAPCSVLRGGKRWKVTLDSLQETDKGLVCNVINDVGQVFNVLPKHLTVDCVQFYDNNYAHTGREHALQFLGAADVPTPTFERVITVKQKRKRKETIVSNEKRRKLHLH